MKALEMIFIAFVIVILILASIAGVLISTFAGETLDHDAN